MYVDNILTTRRGNLKIMVVKNLTLKLKKNMRLFSS